MEMQMLMALPHFRELPSDARDEQRARVLAAVQPSRRRRVVLAVAVALAVLAAAPTLAFQRELVDFWSAEPAPGPVQLDFDRLRQSSVDARGRGYSGPAWTPVGTGREVLATTVDGKRESLWVVQAGEGGFCLRWVTFGTCHVPGDGTEAMKIGGGGLATDHGEGSAWVVGRVIAPEIHAIELVYEDGERAKVPFVWVSPPIDAGFYAFGVPAEHQVPGRLAGVLVGVDEDGNEVTHHCLPLHPDRIEGSEALRPYCTRPR
jgi:hypothetical protein